LPKLEPSCESQDFIKRVDVIKTTANQSTAKTLSFSPNLVPFVKLVEILDWNEMQQKGEE